MNIDKIIRKMLLEDDKQDIRGFDFKDQYDILEKGKLYCSDLKARAGNKNVKRMESKDIAKFPALVGNSEIAYVTSDKLQNGSIIMFFAIQDPDSKGERTFYTYNVLPGQAPRKYTTGWGKGCPQMQETSELGNLMGISIFFDSPALRGNSCTSSTNGSRASNFFMELT